MRFFFLFRFFSFLFHKSWFLFGPLSAVGSTVSFHSWVGIWNFGRNDDAGRNVCAIALTRVTLGRSRRSQSLGRSRNVREWNRSSVAFCACACVPVYVPIAVRRMCESTRGPFESRIRGNRGATGRRLGPGRSLLALALTVPPPFASISSCIFQPVLCFSALFIPCQPSCWPAHPLPNPHSTSLTPHSANPIVPCNACPGSIDTTSSGTRIHPSIYSHGGGHRAVLNRQRLPIHRPSLICGQFHPHHGPEKTQQTTERFEYLLLVHLAMPRRRRRRRRRCRRSWRAIFCRLPRKSAKGRPHPILSSGRNPELLPSHYEVPSLPHVCGVLSCARAFALHYIALHCIALHLHCAYVGGWVAGDPGISDGPLVHLFSN